MSSGPDARLLLTLLATGMLLGAGACERSPAGVTPIEPAALAARIENGTAPVVLDVRTPDEYAAGHIPGAINIPHDELAGRLDDLTAAQSDEIVVHCERGARAGAAEDTLSAAGYENLRDLDGHMQAWRASGLPVE